MVTAPLLVLSGPPLVKSGLFPVNCVPLVDAGLAIMTTDVNRRLGPTGQDRLVAKPSDSVLDLLIYSVGEFVHRTVLR